MVYTTQRIRVIPKPSDQPISIGEGETPAGGIPAIGALNNLLQNLFPGYRPIDFPAPSTVSDGGIPDVVGTGGGAATGSGLGEGEIVKVEVPSSAASGSTFLIKSTFKNKSAATQNFSLHIIISPLGINTVTPTVSLTAGQQSIIESTIILPNVQYGGNFPGAVELRSVTGTNVILFQDSEAFTLAVVGSGTTSGGAAAAITPSASSVLRGQSISINCLNFGPNEVIDFIAKVGNTVVATDNKTAGANGAVVLSTLTFSTSAPTGTAVITATGRTTNKIATAQVTVTSTATPTATILPSAATVQQGKSLAIACSNFTAAEIVDIVAKVGTTVVATDNHLMGSAGSGTEPDLTFSTTSPLGTAIITATGRTSGRTATYSVTVTAGTVTSTTAKIVPSATSVKQGASISIACTNFGALERIDFIAKVGTTTVSTDNKTTLSSGSIILDTLTFSTSSPLGTATITATGAISHKVATATVTVTAATPTTTTATISSSKSTYTVGETIAVTGTGYQAGELVQPYVTVGGVVRSTGANVNASSTGTVSASTPTGSTIGGGHVHLKGLTSMRHAEKGITIAAAPTTVVAKITLSASSVKQGASISITGTGFQAGERVGFWATPSNNHSLTIAGDNKYADSSGNVKLDTLTFSTTAPLGTATVFALGRTSLRQATATVNVVSSTSTTTASISAPSEVHDGDTFTVTGKGFQGGEKVTTTVSGVWKSSSSTYNNKSFSASTTITASSTGTFAVSVKTPEVPSGVSTIATIKSQGLTSGRIASRTISVI